MNSSTPETIVIIGIQLAQMTSVLTFDKDETNPIHLTPSQSLSQTPQPP